MDAIPRFFLYGETATGADLRFVHVETIAARSRQHDWRIAPHRHSDLFQLLLITGGGAEVRLDSRDAACAAPALVIVPPAGVHGFRFRPDSEGWVLTMAAAFAAEVAGPGRHQTDLGPMLGPAILALEPAELASHRLAERLREIETESRWTGLDRAAAIAALVRLLFIAIARLGRERAQGVGVPEPDSLLFRRFRALVEARFRTHLPVGAYARTLGVSEKRLALACRRVMGRAPLEIIHDRLLLEAKRGLLYTSMTVAEIAYDLGFRDPAYFSRFFVRLAGSAPSGFARAQSSSNGSPT